MKNRPKKNEKVFNDSAPRFCFKNKIENNGGISHDDSCVLPDREAIVEAQNNEITN